MRHALQLDLDGAWPAGALSEVECLDLRSWGPQLRYSATRKGMREFEDFISAYPTRFTLFGSGDYHHLSSLWLRRLHEPFSLLSFDNHPDWDIRPPKWCCGTWISRALESPLLQQATIWGCGNFELDRPNSFFANHRGLRSGRLAARPWAERLKPASRPRWPTITPETWRAQFSAYAQSLEGRSLYITVDFDCLRASEAATNWESGLFTAEDVSWAIGEVKQHAQVVAGDVCGAWSEQHYARFRQRIEGNLDHPKLPVVDTASALERNLRSLHTIWPVLAGGA
jgi:hypothetical protein